MRATTFRGSVLLTWMTCCYGNNSQCACVRAWAPACEKNKIKCIFNCDYCRNANGHLFTFHQVHCQGRKKKTTHRPFGPKLSLESARKHEGTSAAASLREEPSPFNKRRVSASQSLYRSALLQSDTPASGTSCFCQETRCQGDQTSAAGTCSHFIEG